MTDSVCMLVTNPASQDPRVCREAKALTDAGYRVTVIAVQITESDGSEDKVDGYAILRIPHPRLMLRRLKEFSPALYGALRKAYRCLTRGGKSEADAGGTSEESFRPYQVSGIGRLRSDCLTIIDALWINLQLAKSAWREQATIYHAHDLDTLLAGWIVARLRRRPLIYDFHELYTEQFQDGVKSNLWKYVYGCLERHLAGRADLRLTVCNSLGEWLSRQYGVPGSVTVKNVPEFRAFLRGKPSGGQREKVILYHGLYFRNRGLEQLIESARFLREGRIVLRGYGDWEPYLRNLVGRWRLEDRVEFAAPVPMSELVKAAMQADIGVAPFLPVCLNTRYCLPNKLFEYMMAGLAVVGSDLPEMRKVIVGCDVGIVCRPNDPQDLANVLNEMLSNEARLESMKQNALRMARTVFNWEIEQQVLLKAYESLRAA